jgi:hypothetical protein
MPVENQLLQVARIQIPSTRARGKGLSRDELAIKINDYLWDRYRQRADLDANYIGKLERGIIAWPNHRYREALRHVLNVSNDSTLGFHNTRRATVARDISPRSSLALLLAGIEAPPQPRRVTKWHVDNIVHVAETIKAAHHLHGGWSMHDAVVAEIRHAARLLALPCPGELRQSLHTAVAHLAHTAGFGAFDGGQHDTAFRFFNFGLSCAQDGCDPHSSAYVLSSMARLATWIGQNERGLAYADRALLNACELTHTEQAMLHAARARSLASMHDVPGAIRALGAADEHFADSTSANDPVWMAYYDYPQHCGDTGTALLDLARAGHRIDQAFERLTDAYRRRDSRYRRSQTMSQILLATLTVTVGDQAQAVAIGNNAIDLAKDIHSHNILDLLGGLYQASTVHNGHPAVRELRATVTNTIRLRRTSQLHEA